MKRTGLYILILALALAIIIIKKFKGDNQSNRRSKSTSTKIYTDRDKGFDRRITFLEYSNHAKCRMECRHITQAEVEEIMQDGKINYNKSDLQNARCPRYAVEGVTADKQDVRIVFAQCNEKTEVVTVIDLDTDWTCQCPGDDKKYDNKN